MDKMPNAMRESKGIVRIPSHSKKTVVQEIPSRQGAELSGIKL